jgi:hypothetical protein
MLANNLLTTRLGTKGYYQCATMLGLWHHKWRPIMFVLIVDDLASNTLDAATLTTCSAPFNVTARSSATGTEPSLPASI